MLFIIQQHSTAGMHWVGCNSAVNQEHVTDLDLAVRRGPRKYDDTYTVDSRYLEIEGTSETVRDIRTSTYQICSIEEKTI